MLHEVSTKKLVWKNNEKNLKKFKKENHMLNEVSKKKLGRKTMKKKYDGVFKTSI